MVTIISHVIPELHERDTSEDRLEDRSPQEPGKFFDDSYVLGSDQGCHGAN